MVCVGVWVFWAERNPELEREARIQIQEYLEEQFPEGMTLPDEMLGFVPRSEMFPDDRPPRVVLVHGLDEPGGIWDELVLALDDAGINAWEFRYPNDQAIDHSADLLAEYWQELDSPESVVLVGHSMGGLVIRDFVTRWRYPEDGPSRVEGRPVDGVILVATPNQGSDWARLRVWLEVREFFADASEGRFSLFAGLRDGTGAAKIDLRPDSTFLSELNDRSWPKGIDVHILGGILSEPTPAMKTSLRVLAEDLDSAELVDDLVDRWREAGKGIGDGAVPAQSLEMSGAPSPELLVASHRGLLVPISTDDGQPPAIAPILEILQSREKVGTD